MFSPSTTQSSPSHSPDLAAPPHSPIAATITIHDPSTDKVQSGCEDMAEISESSVSKNPKDLSEQEHLSRSQIEDGLTSGDDGVDREYEVEEEDSSAEGTEDVDSYNSQGKATKPNPNFDNTATNLTAAPKKSNNTTTKLNRTTTIPLPPLPDSHPEEGYHSIRPMSYSPPEDTNRTKSTNESTPLISNRLSSTPGSGLENFPRYQEMQELVGSSDKKKPCCCMKCMCDWWVYSMEFDDGQDEEIEEA
ncbi:MAG: hypothetical protein Q9213_001744 [Squamulea squamosa]